MRKIVSRVVSTVVMYGEWSGKSEAQRSVHNHFFTAEQGFAIYGVLVFFPCGEVWRVEGISNSNTPSETFHQSATLSRRFLGYLKHLHETMSVVYGLVQPSSTTSGIWQTSKNFRRFPSGVAAGSQQGNFDPSRLLLDISVWQWNPFSHLRSFYGPPWPWGGDSKVQRGSQNVFTVKEQLTTFPFQQLQ